MIRNLIFVLVFIFLEQVGMTQPGQQAVDFVVNIPEGSTSTTQSLANYLRQNYKSDTAQVKAIYGWITHNISYDLALLQNRAVLEGKMPPTADEILKSKKAVCQGYSALFVDLCSALGIKAQMVPGYGKVGNGLSSLSHAWVAAQLQSKWYLFDPTWGAGYVENNRFVKSFNKRFYMVSPEQMLKDHMPFDPMHQFVNHPINNKDFIDGQTAINAAKPFFNYTDTMKHHETLSKTEKFRAEARRLEKNGVSNDLIREQVRQLKKGVEVYGSNDSYALAIEHHKQAGTIYNQYLEYRKKKFSGIEDAHLLKLIDSVSYYTNLSRSILFTIVAKDEAYRQNLAGFHQNIEKFQKGLVYEKDLINRYLALDKTGRERFFGAR